MKKSFLLALSITASCSASAQHLLTGRIISVVDSSAIPGVSISVDEKTIASDAEGRFAFTGIQKGIHQVICKSFFIGLVKKQITIQRDTDVVITVKPKQFTMEEQVVSATRAGARTPVAFSEIDKEQISKSNYGQDIPFLLNSSPSVVATSDAGNAIGYTGIRIRGTDPSRINVSINNIPLNDAESQQVYWVDLPDMASSVENIQVQRGVGTSSNGAASFGGSINVKTASVQQAPFAQADFAAGSFNTFKSTLSTGTGLLNGHWFMEGRLSKIVSDGYMDRASSNLKSFFITTGFSAKRTLLRAVVFSGKEVTFQSWNGVPESRINNDAAGMQEYIWRNFSTEEEAQNLLNSGRSYNYYTYKNQVDDYQQDHYQLHLSQQVGNRWLFSAGLHYTYGRGFYEEFKYGSDYYGDGAFSSYGLPDVLSGSDTITSSDLVRRKWLDNDFYGFTASLSGDMDNKQKIIIGGAFNRYDGRHYNELKWLQYSFNIPPDYRYYQDTAVKDDGNIYAKYTFDITSGISIYIDQQLRSVQYDFNGFADSESGLVPQHFAKTFYNPKAGIYINAGKDHTFYLSAGVSHKEPNRDDFKESTARSRPKPEQLTDYEAGWHFNIQNLTADVNCYYMDYKDQLVLTGALNDVGNYTRTNVASSYRSGIELMTDAQFRKFSAGGNLTLSRNRVSSFTEFITDYDNGIELEFIYKNTDIAFSPSVISYVYAGYNPFRDFNIRIAAKHVGRQYLDNTSDDKRKINPYSVVDLILSWSAHPQFVKEVNFSLSLNNILDTEYISNGYTYGYYYGGTMVRENLYYPQATFNLMARVGVKF